MKNKPNLEDVSLSNPILKQALRRCHERQFNGEDYQGVAIDAWNELGSPEQNDCEVFHFLCSSPEPGCECGFCATADWQS